MTPAQRRAIEWLATDRTGLSSEVMAFWLIFQDTLHEDQGKAGHAQAATPLPSVVARGR